MLHRDSCYMCRNVATSREHVPPVCFFPEYKDLPDGVDLRRQLITVPSCAEHNLQVSKDDEYALLAVTTAIGTNAIARTHFRTKIQRAVENAPGLAHTVYGKQTPVLVNGLRTGMIELDLTRLDRVFDKVTRGLWWKHSGGEKLLEPIVIHSTTLLSTDNRVNQAQAEIRGATQRLFEKLPVFGENPDVFYFQVAERSDSKSWALRFVFFDGFEVVATWGELPGSAGTV